MNPHIQTPTTKAMISTAASMAAAAMFVRSFAKDFVPHELRQYVLTKFYSFLATFTNEMTIVIDEYEGLNENQLFSAVETYLGTIMSPSTRRFRASLPEKEDKVHVSMEKNQEIRDEFCGFQLKWALISNKSQSRYVPYHDEYYSSTVRTEVQYFELCFHKKYKSKVLDDYLPYILERSKSINQETKMLRLYTLKNERVHGTRVNPWQSVNLDHPSTFETLAMDTEIKNMVIEDLERFVNRKDYYRKVGKAWKRGYLLFGPPGTGKSSLIAAMANYLKFDVYDLELTNLRSNSELRRLIISTANRSILVVEDIDASIDLQERQPVAAKLRPPQMYPYQENRVSLLFKISNIFFVLNEVDEALNHCVSIILIQPQVTLSGLLNFVDGLWSSCGDERIIIFTTNHKEKLEPALLRPGRMDVHIHMSYCTPCGFKMLVSNYLGITEHPSMIEAEQLIATSKVTPAEVGEQLLKSNDPEVAFKGLTEFIKEKKETEEAKQSKEYQEAPKTEVSAKSEEEKDGVNCEMMNVTSLGGLKQLIEKVKTSPSNAQELLMNRDEASNALKGLIEFLEGKNRVEDVKASGTNSGISTSAYLNRSMSK